MQLCSLQRGTVRQISALDCGGSTAIFFHTLHHAIRPVLGTAKDTRNLQFVSPCHLELKFMVLLRTKLVFSPHPTPPHPYTHLPPAPQLFIYVFRWKGNISLTCSLLCFDRVIRTLFHGGICFVLFCFLSRSANYLN